MHLDGDDVVALHEEGSGIDRRPVRGIGRRAGELVNRHGRHAAGELRILVARLIRQSVSVNAVAVNIDHAAIVHEMADAQCCRGWIAGEVEVLSKIDRATPLRSARVRERAQTRRPALFLPNASAAPPVNHAAALRRSLRPARVVEARLVSFRHLRRSVSRWTAGAEINVVSAEAAEGWPLASI